MNGIAGKTSSLSGDGKRKGCCDTEGVPERLESVVLFSSGCDGDWARKCGRTRTVAGGECQTTTGGEKQGKRGKEREIKRPRR